MPLPVALTSSKDQIPWTRANGLDICLFIPHKKYAGPAPMLGTILCSGTEIWLLLEPGLGKQTQRKSREMSVAKDCLKGSGMVLSCEEEDETRHEDSDGVNDRTNLFP